MKWKRARKFGFPTNTWYLQGKLSHAVIGRHDKDTWYHGVFAGKFENRHYLFPLKNHTPNKAYAKWKAQEKMKEIGE